MNESGHPQLHRGMSGWSCYVTIQYALEQTYDMQYLLRMIVVPWNDLPQS